jgi:hypothetical protein
MTPDNTAWQILRKLPNPPTLMELTAKVNFFNRIVQANCERLMYQYVEINSELEDPDTGVIKEAFFWDPQESDSRIDHHLDFRKAWWLWVQSVQQALRLSVCSQVPLDNNIHVGIP